MVGEGDLDLLSIARVSGTVRALVAGAGIEFSDRGTVSLRGVPEEQQLFAVERA